MKQRFIIANDRQAAMVPAMICPRKEIETFLTVKELRVAYDDRSRDLARQVAPKILS